MLRVLVVFALSACGRIGFDPLGGATGDDTGPVDGNATLDTPAANCTAVPNCPAKPISVGNGSTASDSQSVGPDNGIGGSCGGNANPQASWQLNPLSTGTYTVTVTSVGLTLIHIRDVCCTGPELICVPPGMPAVIQRQQGQTAIIFIEAAGTASIMVQAS
jgi:hypothetical protein